MLVSAAIRKAASGSQKNVSGEKRDYSRQKHSDSYKYDKILISSFTSNPCGFFGVGKRNPRWMGFLSTDGRSVGELGK